MLPNPLICKMLCDDISQNQSGSDSSVGKKNLPTMQETSVLFLGQEDPLEKEQATHSSTHGFPCGSAGKESACNVGDLGLIPGLGGSPGEGDLQYCGLENSMDCIPWGRKESDMTE